MSSTPPTPLPTLYLLPPPALLPSPHHPAIEPASLAISALLGSLALVFIITFLIRNPKGKGNFLDGTSATPEEEQAEKQLSISGPLDAVLRRNGNGNGDGNDGNDGNDGMGHPIPRLWSGFSSSNEEIERVGTGREEGERRRAVELDDMPARMPDRSHNGMAGYPTYPVELDVMPRSPQDIHHRYPDTYAGRPIPPPPPPPKIPIPLPQRDLNPYTTNYNTPINTINNNRNQNGESSRPPPLRPAPHNPRYSFGDDDTTVVGDKADVETLRSDLSFPDTDSDRGSDSASYEGGDVDGRKMGLVGRHWE